VGSGVFLTLFLLISLPLTMLEHKIMAGWMANPNTNSLQYKDFVTNFLSSSFVDVQQHRLTEFPDQFAYGS
jgi:hypothetical protein